MTVILRVGQTLQLPSRNCVVVVEIRPGEAVCLYGPGASTRGEVTFASAWLARVAIVVDPRP